MLKPFSIFALIGLLLALVACGPGTVESPERAAGDSDVAERPVVTVYRSPT